MYLRIKRTKRRLYCLYLVKTIYGGQEKPPLQKTIKYLGRIEKYSKNEINKIKELLKENEIKAINYIIELKNKKNNNYIENIRKYKYKKCIMCGFNLVVHLILLCIYTI